VAGKTGSSIHHKSFIDQLEALKKIINEVETDSSQMLCKMTFTYAVTLLESYLGDTAKSLVSSSDVYFKNAITKVEELKKARFSLDSLSNGQIDAKGLAVKELSNILYHNIPKVIKVIESILNIKIKIQLDEIVKITELRHDIAHRNGQTKDGKSTLLSPAVVNNTIEKLVAFSKELQKIINDAEKA
jgi:lambda repressor-like predicted transcriptional regulator